jgi:hypothetical protein
MQAITATSTKKADLVFGEIQSQIKNNNITVDVKANSSSNVGSIKYSHMYCFIPDLLHLSILVIPLESVIFPV